MFVFVCLYHMYSTPLTIYKVTNTIGDRGNVRPVYYQYKWCSGKMKVQIESLRISETAWF